MSSRWKLGKGLAVLASLAVMSSTANSSHWDEWSQYCCFRDISYNGYLDDDHSGWAEMKYNTKTHHLHMKAERSGIRNSSCEKYSEHHLPGHYFWFPYHWGLDCHYQVWAHDCDNSHDEDAKLHGHNGDGNGNDDNNEA